MFHGALGTTSLPLYCCLAAAAQTLFLAFLAFTSGGWFWCVDGFLLALLSWIPASGGFRPFDCLLPTRQAGALGYKYGVNQKLWFSEVYPRVYGDNEIAVEWLHQLGGIPPCVRGLPFYVEKSAAFIGNTPVDPSKPQLFVDASSRDFFLPMWMVSVGEVPSATALNARRS